jgi:drug/metabolite transporter (DMT)-like permease
MTRDGPLTARAARSSSHTSRRTTSTVGDLGWQRTAVVTLVGIALVWGVAFSVVKGVVASVAPATLVTWRFSVGTLTLLVLRPRCLVGLSAATWRRAAGLGCLLGTGFLVHTVGMHRSSVVSAAFLTGTVVIFAPLAARIGLGRAMTWATVVAVSLAAGGLALITFGHVGSGLGDLLILSAAMLWGVHLVGLESWTRAPDVYPVAVIQLGVVSILAATVQLSIGGELGVPVNVRTLSGIFGLGAVATGVTFLLLTWTQTRVDATTAAVILTLEPVFGAATAVSLGEHLSLRAAVGGAAVVVAGALVVVPRTRASSRDASPVRCPQSP